MPKNIKEDKFKPINTIKLFSYNDYFSIFVGLYKSKRFPKVTLFTGEKGLGKFTLAFHLVNYFFTSGDVNSYDLKNLSLNVDNTFYKKILSNVNENYIYIGKDEGEKISVDEIREIKKKFSTKSLNNLPRFIILDDVDLLNLSSANALLKLIEEPSDLNNFILINNKRKKIIDTLRSRSIEFNIFLNKDKKQNIVNKLSEKFKINQNSFSKFMDKTTPGTFIRVCDCIENLNIDIDISLDQKAEILLDKYKKDKKDIYLETFKFLLDIEIDKNIKFKKNNLLQLGFLKKNITKLIHDYENFNLSKNTVIESLKALPRNV